MWARKARGAFWPERPLSSACKFSKVPALCYGESKLRPEAKGPGHFAFLATLNRERLEELCTNYEFENSNLQTQRVQLRGKLRRLVGRYLQIKLPSMGLALAPTAARETLGQLSGAQQHRVRELENEQMSLRLRVRSLGAQLGVQRRLADQIRAGITHTAKDSDDEHESKFLANHMKAEVERLREMVEEKKQELAHLRQGLALWRREAQALRQAVRVAQRAIEEDVLDIRRRRRKMARDEDLAAIRECPMRQAASYTCAAYPPLALRRALSSD